MTKGYSGSDLSTLVKEAAYEPLRIAIRAIYFKKVNNLWRPCSPSDDKRVMMRIWEVPNNEV